MATSVEGLSADAYREQEGVSASDIKHILPPKTPAHYYAHITDQIKREETRAFLLGTLSHLAVLEPDKLETAFVVRPDGIDLRTKDGKAWKESFGNIPVIDKDEAAMLQGIQNSIAKHPAASRLLQGTMKEVSMFAPHRSGIRIKGRIDALGNGYIVDVKTAEAGDMQNFASAIFRYNYHVQAAMYCHLANTTSFSFIVVEKAPPYAVSVYELSTPALQAGMNALNDALELIAQCEDRKEWPAYSADRQTIDLPAWAYTQIKNNK